MIKYAEIHNNKVIQIHGHLPECWNNISNFHILSIHELQDLSWSGNIGVKFYIVVDSPRPNINEKLYSISGPNYIIDDNNKQVNIEWIIEQKSNNIAWTTIKADRDRKLMYCDWTQLPDCPLNEDQKEQYRTYRQNLRDITQQQDPFNIVWPQEPAFSA